MKKWIPIYGMFTKEANQIPPYSNINMIMVLYHGFVTAGILLTLIFTLI